MKRNRLFDAVFLHQGQNRHPPPLPPVHETLLRHELPSNNAFYCSIFVLEILFVVNPVLSKRKY